MDWGAQKKVNNWSKKWKRLWKNIWKILWSTSPWLGFEPGTSWSTVHHLTDLAMGPRGCHGFSEVNLGYLGHSYTLKMMFVWNFQFSVTLVRNHIFWWGFHPDATLGQQNWKIVKKNKKCLSLKIGTTCLPMSGSLQWHKTCFGKAHISVMLWQSGLRSTVENRLLV